MKLRQYLQNSLKNKAKPRFCQGFYGKAIVKAGSDNSSSRSGGIFGREAISSAPSGSPELPDA
jgi:hypothetical protein